jgi:hypothetical protein
MRFNKSYIAAAVVLGAAPCLAQSSPADASTILAPARQWSFDLAAAGLNVGYALRNSDKTSFGASLGVGGNWLNYMALGGSHFAESDGLSYQAKDGSTNKGLLELARAGVFVRRHFEQGRQVDVGLKGSAFLHSDSSDDDPGGGVFMGMNVTAMWWRWRQVRLGSELDAGAYMEPHAKEFGVNVAPVLLRITIP